MPKLHEEWSEIPTMRERLVQVHAQRDVAIASEMERPSGIMVADVQNLVTVASFVVVVVMKMEIVVKQLLNLHLVK